MRRVRYQVAASLDGYIAGPNGEADWIVADPEIDFGALFAQFDTMLIGRHTYEGMGGRGGGMPGMKVFVFSRTLEKVRGKGVTLVRDDAGETVRNLREQAGKDIWLFGGGQLFSSLAAAGLVDTVEVAIVPVLLGGGVPLHPSPGGRHPLELTGHRIYETSGIVLLEYALK